MRPSLTLCHSALRPTAIALTCHPSLADLEHAVCDGLRVPHSAAWLCQHLVPGLAASPEIPWPISITGSSLWPVGPLPLWPPPPPMPQLHTLTSFSALKLAPTSTLLHCRVWGSHSWLRPPRWKQFPGPTALNHGPGRGTESAKLTPLPLPGCLSFHASLASSASVLQSQLHILFSAKPFCIARGTRIFPGPGSLSVPMYRSIPCLSLPLKCDLPNACRVPSARKQTYQ